MTCPLRWKRAFFFQGFSLPDVLVFPGLLQKQLVGKRAYFLRGWNPGGYSLLLLVALFSLQDACKWSTVKDCRSERRRHHWSLWIQIPSCINQSDSRFPTFTTQSFHSGVDGDGLGHFLVRFARANLSEHLWVYGQCANGARFPGVELGTIFWEKQLFLS